MQYIFQETIIHYEWMPDGIVKDILDEFGHAHQLHEGASFSLESIIEWAEENDFQEYHSELTDFMAEEAITKSAIVRWEW